MVAVTTDLLIGSYPLLPEQTLTITASASATAHDIDAGNYYLYDDGSAFDLLTALAACINDHAALSGVTVVIQRDLHIRIQGGATAFAVVWPLDGILRDLLGFTANLGSATSHTAPNISPLLWSGGRTATYEARLGTDGIPCHDTAVGQSATGIVRATSHNVYRRNTLSWRYILNARVWAEEEGGEFFAFFHSVLRLYRRFKVWREIVEDDSSTTAITFDDELPSSGAYVYNSGNRPVEMPWGREFGFTETVHPITVPVVTSPEYE